MFFLTSLENECVYIMKKIGEIEFPSCPDDLPLFINMKIVNDLLQISRGVFFGKSVILTWIGV